MHMFLKATDFINQTVFFTKERQRQEPILLAARNVVDGACHIVECSKSLIVNSREASIMATTCHSYKVCIRSD